jgi:hypothetical protein
MIKRINRLSEIMSPGDCAPMTSSGVLFSHRMPPSIDHCSHFSLFVPFNDALQVNDVYCECIERAVCSNPIYPQRIQLSHARSETQFQGKLPVTVTGFLWG